MEPKFEDLKNDKQVWESFKQIETEIEQKNKLKTAHQYAMWTQQLEDLSDRQT